MVQSKLITTEDAPLTEDEETALARCENTIRDGLQTFYQVGNALAEVRDERLYRKTNKTFEDYCGERWGMTRRHVDRLIASAETVDNLRPIGLIPTTESQARPIADLEPDRQREVWQRAVETAPNGKMTAAHVEQVREQIAPRQVIVPRTEENADLIGDGIDDVWDAPMEPAQVVDLSRPMKPKINRAGSVYEARGFDACQTPGYAIDPLLPYLSEGWTIWEPACGEGNLLDALYEAGHDAIGTDIIQGCNFFEHDPETWDCLITNPPYSIKYQWLERCYQLGRPFALLLPVETLGAQRAQALFIEHGVQIILFDKRINFKMPNVGWEGSSAQFPVAWFTWGLELETQIVFAKLRGEM